MANITLIHPGWGTPAGCANFDADSSGTTQVCYFSPTGYQVPANHYTSINNVVFITHSSAILTDACQGFIVFVTHWGRLGDFTHILDQPSQPVVFLGEARSANSIPHLFWSDTFAPHSKGLTIVNVPRDFSVGIGDVIIIKKEPYTVVSRVNGDVGLVSGSSLTAEPPTKGTPSSPSPQIRPEDTLFVFQRHCWRDNLLLDFSSVDDIPFKTMTSTHPRWSGNYSLWKNDRTVVAFRGTAPNPEDFVVINFRLFVVDRVINNEELELRDLDGGYPNVAQQVNTYSPILRLDAVSVFRTTIHPTWNSYALFRQGRTVLSIERERGTLWATSGDRLVVNGAAYIVCEDQKGSEVEVRSIFGEIGDFTTDLNCSGKVFLFQQFDPNWIISERGRRASFAITEEIQPTPIPRLAVLANKKCRPHIQFPPPTESEVNLFYITDREWQNGRFTHNRAHHLNLGSLKVRNNTVGGWVAIGSLAELMQRISIDGYDSCLLFIHGYNNTFAGAASDFARLAVGFTAQNSAKKTCFILLSWPSHGQTLQYYQDKSAVRSSTKRFAEAIDSLRCWKPNRIHVIGHSMGGYLLFRCLRRLPERPQRLGEVIWMAANFKKNSLQDHYRSDRFYAHCGAPATSYYCKADQALGYYATVDMHHQVGKGSVKITPHSHRTAPVNSLGHLLDNVEVPEAIGKKEDGSWCHTYFWNEAIVFDLFVLVNSRDNGHRLSPQERFLSPKSHAKGWKLQPKVWFGTMAWDQYLILHPDVERSEFRLQPWTHYTRHGYHERRIICVLNHGVYKYGTWYDAGYRRINPDVAAVFGDRDFQGWAHYHNHGFQEQGRLLAVVTRE